MSGRVVHLKRETYDVLIARPSKWGNPFTFRPSKFADTIMVATREEAIERYEAWLLEQPDLLAALPELEGKTLGCWCAPKACHGHVLLDYAEGRKAVTS